MRNQSTRNLVLLVALLATPALSMFAGARASAQAPATATVTLRVEGMHCATCPITVRTALRRLDGVREATVNLAARTASVTYDPSRVTPARLAQAVTVAGYPARVER